MHRQPRQPTAELINEAREALCGRRYPPALLARLDALAEDEIRTAPWVALLQGRRLCRLHSRFKEATPLIDGTLATFRAQGDSEGELWALAEWVVMRYHAADYATGLAGIEPFLERSMRPYLRAELLFGRFLCQIGLVRVREAVVAGEAALAALADESDPWLQRVGRIQMLRNIAAGYHYLGKSRRSVGAAEQAVTLAREHPDTADMQPWCFYELGLAYWRHGRLAAATETLDTARRLAETWKHHELWRWAVATQGHVLRDQGRLEAALAAYQLADCWGEDPEGPAFIQLRQGRLAEARWSCEARMQIGRLDDPASGVADAQLLLALVDLRSGRPAAALALLEHVGAIYAAASYGYYHATAQLYRAAAGLALERADIVADGLSHYLHFAAHEEVLTCAWWMPDLIEDLLLYALRHGIEPAWAERLLERRFSSGLSLLSSSTSTYETTELEIARRMQLSLLPELPPAMPDLDIAACVLPAAEVGGDFVGYFPSGALPGSGVQRRLGVAVGDISGKGLGAALLLSGAVVALNTVATPEATPAQVAEALHTAMHPYTSRSRMNIAFCYALLSQQPGGWSLSAVGAGSIPPLVWRASGEVIWLDTTGFPLGTLAARQRYREAQIELAAGDVLLLLSDGIIEAMNGTRELFGFDRLAQTLAAADNSQDAHATLRTIMEAVHRHTAGVEQHDDITIVAVRALAGMAE